MNQAAVSTGELAVLVAAGSPLVKKHSMLAGVSAIDVALCVVVAIVLDLLLGDARVLASLDERSCARHYDRPAW